MNIVWSMFSIVNRFAISISMKSSYVFVYSLIISLSACSEVEEVPMSVHGFPLYYFENSYIDNKIGEIKEAMAVKNGVSFGFLTDIHISKHLCSEDPYSSSGNAGYSPYLLKYVIDSLNIPFVLFGGDVPVSKARDWEEIIGSRDRWRQMMGIIGAEKVFQTRGNHDYLGIASMNTSNVTYCSPKELYPIIMGGERIYDVKAPDGKMYYFFDVDNTNLRVIVLDDYGDKDTEKAISGVSCIGQVQYNWLLEEALNCENKSIILLSHQTADFTLDVDKPDVDNNRKVLHEILSAFTNKKVLNFSSSDQNGAVSVKKDFSNDTNTFICHLSGYRHMDAYAITDGVLSISHTSDCYSGYRYEEKWKIPDRIPGTITEHAVSVFSVDFDSRTLTMTRIGGGEDKVWKY